MLSEVKKLKMKRGEARLNCFKIRKFFFLTRRSDGSLRPPRHSAVSKQRCSARASDGRHSTQPNWHTFRGGGGTTLIWVKTEVKGRRLHVIHVVSIWGILKRFFLWNFNCHANPFDFFAFVIGRLQWVFRQILILCLRFVVNRVEPRHILNFVFMSSQTFNVCQPARSGGVEDQIWDHWWPENARISLIFWREKGRGLWKAAWRCCWGIRRNLPRLPENKKKSKCEKQNSRKITLPTLVL